MIALFSYDEIMEMHDNDIRNEGRVEGRAEGRAEGRSEGWRERDALYGELMKRVAPLGRINDLIAASSDNSKLAELAKEFGLSI